MKNTILNNIENYNKRLDQDESILFLKYIGLIHELIECFTENIFVQNEQYLKFILSTAIKNTLYIFTMLILYTKNMDLTIYHTQKSILYYVEFIGQIGDDNHGFLKLNSKDASLFVFKKTIFDINNEYRKTYDEDEETKNILKKTHEFIMIYNNTLLTYINNNKLNVESLEDLKRIVYTKFYKLVETIIQIPLHCKKKNKDLLKYLNELNVLIEHINTHHNYFFIKNNYLYLVESFIKKKAKIGLDNDKIKKRLNEIDIENKLENFTVCKIINYMST